MLKRDSILQHDRRSRVRTLMSQRCAWLFLALLALLVWLPYMGSSLPSRILMGTLHAAILVSASTLMRINRLSIILVIMLALPALGFQIAALVRDDAGLTVVYWVFGALFYVASLAHLLRYVLGPESMNEDKLFGAAAAYLMLGMTWSYCYGIVQYFYPWSFAVHGSPVFMLPLFDTVYFSFTVLTSTGFGDIAALTPQARSLANLESICGILFVAILVARLVGVYPGVSKE